MSIFATAFSRFSTFLPRFRAGSLVTFLVLAGVGAYSVMESSANRTGITGFTQKSNNTGCYCHCSSSNSGTSVAFSTGATSFQTGQSYTFSVTVSNSSESGAGVDISTYYGSLTAGTGLYVSNGELTHTSPKSSLPATWSFTYTAPSNACDDTLYATGNAVDLDNSSDNGVCWDKWNFSQKYIIHVVAPYQPKRFAINRTSINLGQVRVGTRKKDTTKIISTGAFQLTVNTSAMKSGTVFSTNSQNGVNSRNLAPTVTEVDTVTFTPLARGTFNDSLIFTTNSDTIPDQRKGLAVTAQAIQASFTNALSTLAFGNVKLSATPPRMLFIYSNSGDDTLMLSQPAITGSAFTIAKAPTSLNLLPNAIDTVIVQFAPTGKQAYTGSLTFTASNGVTAPTIALSGTGVAPQLQANTSSAIGSSRVGTPMQGLYTIKNIGTDTLHIFGVTLNPATGSRFALGAFDASVLPNANGTFHLTYTPTAEKSDSVQLKFTTDDPAIANFTAQITANGVLPHMALDTTTVNVGQTRANTSISHDFAVQNTGGADLTLNVSLEADPAYSILSSPQLVQAGSTGYVSIKFLPTATGNFTGRLIISGDDASNPRDTINFTGSGINSSLTITPANANFSYVSVGLTAYDTLVLSNSGNATVKILSYKYQGPSNFAILDSSTKQVAPNGTGRIVVRFKPTDETGYSGTLTLTTDEASPTRIITLGGAGIRGMLTPTPNAFDFGTVDTGQSKTVPATLKNTGSAPITMSSLVLIDTAGEFSFVATPAAPATIQPNGTVDLEITFTPHRAGFTSGALKLTTDDGTTGNIITFAALGHIAQSNNSVATQTIPGLRMTIAPNPAHAATACMMTLDEAHSIRMFIVDALGREVIQKNLGMISAGDHRIELPLAELPAGSYFVRLTSENGSMETKLVLER